MLLNWEIKLSYEIKQLKSEIDELKKEAYEKDSIIKAITGTTASIEETGWQTEYPKSRYVSDQTNKSL